MEAGCCYVPLMRIVVTAGPTREAIDPVRFISNRSSGRMGYAIAEEAAARGHVVVLIAGPVALADPPGAQVIRVTTCEDMLAAVGNALESCDALVMAAAVADWRPVTVSAEKIKKSRIPPVIRLEPAPDILKTLRPRKGGRIFVGFAAETGNPLPEAVRKLRDKGLDMIVANDVSQADAGFDVETNRCTLVTGEDEAVALPLMSKMDVAGRILDWIEKRRAG